MHYRLTALLAIVFMAGCQSGASSSNTLSDNPKAPFDLEQDWYEKRLPMIHHGLSNYEIAYPACLRSDIPESTKEIYRDVVRDWEKQYQPLLDEISDYLDETYRTRFGNQFIIANSKEINEFLVNATPEQKRRLCLENAHLLKEQNLEKTEPLGRGLFLARSSINPFPPARTRTNLALAGTWEGERGTAPECQYLYWKAMRNTDGTYEVSFYSHKDETTPIQVEKGRWYTYGNRYFEHSERTRSPDIYTYEIQGNRIRYQSVSLSPAGDCTQDDYEFYDNRVD